MTVSSCERTLVCGVQDYETACESFIYLVDMQSHQITRQEWSFGQNVQVRCMTYAPAGDIIAVSTFVSGVQTWDRRGSALHMLTCRRPQVHQLFTLKLRDVISLAFDASGKILVAYSELDLSLYLIQLSGCFRRVDLEPSLHSRWDIGKVWSTLPESLASENASCVCSMCCGTWFTRGWICPHIYRRESDLTLSSATGLTLPPL